MKDDNGLFGIIIAAIGAAGVLLLGSAIDALTGKQETQTEPVNPDGKAVFPAEVTARNVPVSDMANPEVSKPEATIAADVIEKNAPIETEKPEVLKQEISSHEEKNGDIEKWEQWVSIEED